MSEGRRVGIFKDTVCKEHQEYVQMEQARRTKQEKNEVHKFNNDSIYRKKKKRNQSEIGVLEEVMVEGER